MLPADYIVENQERLFEIIADLVRIPSENTPPAGDEAACQNYVAGSLSRLGLEPDVYSLEFLPGLRDHPLYWPGRSYRGRPNVAARRPGSGGGRSLILSGHVDTVPIGSLPWTRDPLGAAREANRLYGRGAADTKAGIAINLFVLEALTSLGIRLAGDLIFESVVDEEFGGVNGTLAGRVRGYLADAAVISEPSGLRLLAAQRGGRVLHITFRSASDIFARSIPGGLAVEQLGWFLSRLPDFAALRRNAPPSRYYSAPDSSPVVVTKVSTGPWAWTEPLSIPPECRVELYFQTMPGESQEKVEGEFWTWFRSITEAQPALFATPPQVEFPIRYLPGSENPMPQGAVLEAEFAAEAGQVLGARPTVEGLEAPSDLYVFHQHGIPAVLWGPVGAALHAPDEYVELDSAVRAAQALIRFVCRWCGLASG